MNKIILLSLMFFLALAIQGYATDITTCSNLNVSGTTYNLTVDIANVTTLYCMNLSASNIILDCIGHVIDGVDGLSDYGIYSGLNTLTTNITIRNCVVSDWENGIYFYNVTDSRITNTTSSSSTSGLQFYYVNSTNITNSSILSNDAYGLYLKWSLSTIISNTILNSNNFGLFFLSSNSSNITNVSIHSNNYGMLFNNGKSMIIKNSIIQNNINYGIWIENSNDSLIYNNLFNNTYNFIFEANNTNNSWNTTNQAGTRIYSSGTNIGGNYWTNSTNSGYSDTCIDADENGFCDTTYTLNASNIDYLPYSDEYKSKITNCTSGNITLNFTSRYEDDSSLLNYSMDVTFDYGQSYPLTKNFSYSYRGNDTYYVCIQPSEAAYYANAIIKYWNSSFGTRYYYLDGVILNNVTQNISLYLPNASYAQTTLTIQNSYSQIIEDAKIDIQRGYNGTSYTIAQGKTTGLGIFTFNLNPNIIYNILITSSQGTKDVSLQPILSSYTILLPSGGISFPAYWEAFEGWTDTCTFVNTTPKLTCTWIDVSGHLVGAELKVFSITNNAVICHNTSAFTSGTFECVLPTINNVTYAWALFSKHGSLSEAWLQMNSGLISLYTYFKWGLLGIFMTFVITLTFGFFALQYGRPTFIVFSTLLSIVFCFFMGFISPLESMGGAVIGLLFAGVIIMLKSGG